MLDVDTIFFDVDGTLVDSSEDIAAAMNAALRELGLDEQPLDRIMAHVGTGVRYLVSNVLGPGCGELVDRAVQVFSDYYVAHAADRSRLYPHVREVLDHFAAKRKYILTNRYRKFADATLTGLGIRRYFIEIYGGDDETCLKPSACVIDRERIGHAVLGHRTLMVGDMDIDVMTGKNTGMKTVWVSYGLGKRNEVAPLKPDYMIDDIIELVRIVA